MRLAELINIFLSLLYRLGTYATPYFADDAAMLAMMFC
jgi:hypothetical protein